MRGNRLLPVAMAALLIFGGAACQNDQAEEPMETESMEEEAMESEMDEESMDGEMEEPMDETEEPMDDET